MKRREIDMASNQFPGYWVLHHLEHTEIHRVGQRREGGGKRQRPPGGEKGVSKGGESG